MNRQRSRGDHQGSAPTAESAAVGPRGPDDESHQYERRELRGAMGFGTSRQERGLPMQWERVWDYEWASPHQLVRHGEIGREAAGCEPGRPQAWQEPTAAEEDGGTPARKRSRLRRAPKLEYVAAAWTALQAAERREWVLALSQAEKENRATQAALKLGGRVRQ